MQVQNNTLRKQPFREKVIPYLRNTKDPAMIVYLNNQRRIKDHPNENFARSDGAVFLLVSVIIQNRMSRKQHEAFTDLDGQ